MRPTGYLLVPLSLLALCPRGARAQERLDSKLVIQQGGHEIGREEFAVRPTRNRGAAGSTIVASARYPGTNSVTQLGATLERTTEGSLSKFQLDVEEGGAVTVILAAGSGARLIVRTVAKASESGRELPGGPDVVLLDDRVFSLYGAVADLATAEGRQLTAVFPRSGRRAAFVARRDANAAGSTRVTLTGDLAATLVVDGEGRLQRLEMPSQGLIVAKPN